MIANITRGSSLNSFVEYNEKKVAIGDAELLFCNTFYSDEVNETVNLIRDFGIDNKAKNKYFHISLNFHTDDIHKLDKETLENITLDYLEKMGLNEVPFIVYKHNDTVHPHVHIVVSNSDYDSKIIIQKNERWISQSITRELELKYNIKQVNSKKQNQKLPDKSIQFDSLKDELNYNIDFLLNQYKVQNLAEFQIALNEKNLDFIQLKGVVKDKNKKLVEYDGLIYNKVSIDFKQNQRGIKASSLYNKPTMSFIEEKFIINQEHHKLRRGEIKSSIDLILTNYESISIEMFKKILDNKDIGLNLKYDNSDNLVGISYYDKLNGYKYTGEQIGKKYIAKNFKQNFGTKSILKPEVITKLEINKYIKKFQTENIYENIEHLISIGFNVNYINNSLYINHYSNKDKNGYVSFKKNVILDSTYIDNYKKSNSIDFSNITEKNVLFFNYNKAVLDNNIDYINKLNKDNNSVVNQNINNLEVLFQDTIISSSESIIDDEQLTADMDKNKRKQNRKKF